MATRRQATHGFSLTSCGGLLASCARPVVPVIPTYLLRLTKT